MRRSPHKKVPVRAGSWFRLATVVSRRGIWNYSTSVGLTEALHITACLACFPGVVMIKQEK